MSPAGLDAYLQYGNHLIHIAAAQVDGAWLSWVEFTMDTPYGEGCVEIPIYRHKVPGTFKSNPDCLEAGIFYAAQTIAADAIQPDRAPTSSGIRNPLFH